MAADPNNLIWIDMEMTGLVPDSDRIIEIAVLVTDAQLKLIAEGPVLVVKQPDEVLAAMDRGTGRAGTVLIYKVKPRCSTISGLRGCWSSSRRCCPPAPRRGSQLDLHDRRFLARSMPRLEPTSTTANLDVSTSVLQRWKPERQGPEEGGSTGPRDIPTDRERKYYLLTAMTI